MNKILLVGSSIMYQFQNCKIQNYEIVNVGLPSLITPNLNTIMIENESYNYMIFYCGNNDLKKNINKNEIVTNIKNYIYDFKHNFVKTNIIILSILTSPKNYELELIDDIQYINYELEKINDIYYLDITTELLDKNYYYDDVHLNIDGYTKLNTILNIFIQKDEKLP
jgi:lysophospholipase L1-like esterase